MRADIDYGVARAQTTYGIIGIKVWIYKGERFEEPAKSAIPENKDIIEEKKVIPARKTVKDAVTKKMTKPAANKTTVKTVVKKVAKPKEEAKTESDAQEVKSENVEASKENKKDEA